MWLWSFLIYTVRNHTSENSFTPMQPSLNLPFHFLMKNLLMSDATLEAAVLFLIWLLSLACVAVLCGEGGEREKHDVRVKPAVGLKMKSVINISSIFRLKCLQGGVKSERIPLSERPVLHISLDVSKYERLPSKMTPTLTKMLSSMKAKHIWGHYASCVSHWNQCSVFKD